MISCWDVGDILEGEGGKRMLQMGERVHLLEELMGMVPSMDWNTSSVAMWVVWEILTEADGVEEEIY